jgi:hypothetical protein
MQQYQLNVESRSTALQNEMTTITANYRERTKESKAQYQEYKMKDEKNSKEIRDATIYINRITVNHPNITRMNVSQTIPCLKHVHSCCNQPNVSPIRSSNKSIF